VGLGFEHLNRGIINLTTGTASALRGTQTGVINWNMVGILGGLMILLAILVWGA
jgi:hypothetical protein